MPRCVALQLLNVVGLEWVSLHKVGRLNWIPCISRFPVCMQAILGTSTGRDPPRCVDLGCIWFRRRAEFHICSCVAIADRFKHSADRQDGLWALGLGLDRSAEFSSSGAPAHDDVIRNHLMGSQMPRLGMHRI